MTTANRYAMPIDGFEWIVPENFESCFKWEYEDGSESLHRLYEKGKKQQWNASNRIDWSLDLDPENPEELPDEYISIFGSPVWEKLTRKNGPISGGIRKPTTFHSFFMASRAH